MCARRSDHQQENVPKPSDDFRDPIGFIYQQHERIRICCEQLVQLADDLYSEHASAVATSILDCLEDAWPKHLADEEEDLFPLLEQRSASEDTIVSVLKLLVLEHRDDIESGRSLLEPLRLIATGHQPADPAMFTHFVRAFTMLQRRHQAMENNTVLPLAFERLTPEDKVDLGRKMAARRGVAYRA